MSDMIITRSPEVIATEINVIKAQARDTYVRSAIEIGRRLYEVKTMVPHGKWGEWLQANVDYSERTAQNLMAVYEEYGRSGEAQAIAGLSFTQAVLLLRLDGESRAELLEQKDVPGMSTRELEEEIRRAKAEIEKRQVTIDQLMGAEAQKEARAAHANEAADAMRRERDAAKREAEAAQARMGDAVRRADDVSKENLRLKEELAEEKKRTAPQPVIEQVEVTPPEVEAELEQLRERVKSAPNKEIILLRDAYDSLVKQFGRIEDMIAALGKVQPEEAARYRGAVAAAAAKIAERLST